ncbi:MAG: hypothetical protein OEV55_00935 [candidate division Zixibacteria bacterium]|nr:hypothetical protein [candidate division Zixibacteria bacterium]
MQGTSKIKVLVFVLLILALSTSFNCEVNEPTGPISKPLEGTIIPLEGKIIFSIKEWYKDYESPIEPDIFLKMRTEKIYGCCNYSIETRISEFGNNVSIVILGVYKPSGCYTALGPAKYESFLNLPEGKYRLNFYYKGSVDRYEVEISNSRIEIDQKSFGFTQCEFPLVWRYPPNSFVYLCGATSETQWICDDFYDTLMSKVHLREFEFPDTGKILYPTTTCYYQFNMPAKYFIYKNEDDFDKAGEVLSQYYQDYQDVIVYYFRGGISLINWKYEEYGSATFWCDDP